MSQRLRCIYRLTILLFWVFASNESLGANYYSRASGLWTNPATWSTVTFGGAAAAGTPGAADNVYIGDGHTVSFNTNTTITNLFIGQGSSGTLEFYNLAIYCLTIQGNLTLYNGAVFRDNFNVNNVHRVYIHGNVSNSGQIDFYFDSNDYVDLYVEGSTSTNVNGSGTWDLAGVILNKTTFSSIPMIVQVSAFEAAIRTLSLSLGTYVHDNPGNYTFGPIAGFTIGPNVKIQVDQGVVNFSPSTDNLILQGGLFVNGGQVYVGSTAGSGGIRSDQATSSVVPYLEVNGGLLTVYGSISFRSGSFNEPFSFNMTGGDILLHCGTSGVGSEIFYITDKATSSFTMSGGTITMQRPNTTGGGNLDFAFCGVVGTVNTTGGVIQFGNASTPLNSTFNYKPFPGTTYPVFRISGPASSGNKLQGSNGSTWNSRMLGIEIEPGTTFDNRNISGTSGDSKKVTLTSTVDGTSALINNGTFMARTGEIELAGSAAQRISGTSSISFYNLTINNSSAAGVTLNRPVSITNFLSMTNGLLYSTSVNLPTVTATGNANLGASNSYVHGPIARSTSVASPAALNFPIGKSPNWRPCVFRPVHTAADTVTYIGEVIPSSAAALGFALPPTLSAVSNVRYWRILNTNSARFSSANITLYYGPDDGVADFNSLRVAQGIAPNWHDRGGVGTANITGNITSNNFSAWGIYYALANVMGGTNSLPISLLNFDAEPVENRVEVKWTTVSEINNDHFTVERSSDGINYEPIGTVPGAGNSTSLMYYKFTDSDPLDGVSWYRLRQTDFDGTSVAFDPVRVMFMRKTEFIVYPNPHSGGQLHITMPTVQEEPVRLVVYRSDGALVMDRQMVAVGGKTILLDDINFGADGIYFLWLYTVENVYQQKLLSYGQVKQ